MMSLIGKIVVPSIILHLLWYKLRQHDPELSVLVEDYAMALCIVLLWGWSWWLSISSTDGRPRARGVRLLAYVASVGCLVVVASGLYEVLQVVRGSPVGLARQVLELLLGMLVLIFYAEGRQ